MRADSAALIWGVLAAEGVPTRKAPSGPTEATTLPVGVSKRMTLGATSVAVMSVGGSGLGKKAANSRMKKSIGSQDRSAQDSETRR